MSGTRPAPEPRVVVFGRAGCDVPPAGLRVPLNRQPAWAGAAGATGFLVGRTIWADLIEPDPATMSAVAAALGRRRFAQLVETTQRHCRPLPAGRAPAAVTAHGGTRP